MPELEAHLAKWPNQTAINVCVAAEPGTRTFHRANNHQSSSLLDLGTHKQQAPDVFYTDAFEVETRTVDSLIAEYGINANFLNADLQGGELDALKGAQVFLTGVDYAYMEVNWEPLYEGCGLVGEVDWLMGVYGFDRYDTKMAGNSGWGDAFYARPEALGLLCGQDPWAGCYGDKPR